MRMHRLMINSRTLLLCEHCIIEGGNSTNVCKYVVRMGIWTKGVIRSAASFLKKKGIIDSDIASSIVDCDLDAGTARPTRTLDQFNRSSSYIVQTI